MSINVWSILKFFAYVAIIMFFLFPIAWIFNMSFMTNDEILRKVPVLFYEPTFKNYIGLWAVSYTHLTLPTSDLV